MDTRILVAYATKHGATAEIAERIGAALRHTGLRADVRPANEVGDLAAYTAVVLGSAVYIGRWRGAAAKFLRANAAVLAEKPVWLFSSGPTGTGDPLKLVQGSRLPPKLQPFAEQIAPRDIAVFHGRLDAGRLNMLERWMLKRVGAPVGDFRDWEAIEAWATRIAEALHKAGAALEVAAA